MIFDLHQDGQKTKRVIAINDRQVMCLSESVGEVIEVIDFENEAGDVLIEDIFNYEKPSS